MLNIFRKKDNSKKRSAVIIWTAISMTTLLGFSALAVDLGYLRVIKAQLQNAADAGALGGASAFANDIRFTPSFNPETLNQLAVTRAQAYCAKNMAEGKYLVLDTSDIVVGRLEHPDNLEETISTSSTPYNAVRVTIEKTASSPNGPANLFFASIWGKLSAPLSATATALLSTNLSGYKPKETGGPLIPLTVGKDTWIDQITNRHGPDGYTFNYESENITPDPDGICEMNIYPGQQKEESGSDGAGNFGLLNFENGNNSVNPVGEQIENGLTSDDVQKTIGSDTFVFYKEIVNPDNTIEGVPLSYAIDGTPGLKASLQAAFNKKIGKVVGFFINEQVTGPGNNCVYTITGIQYGILLAADLNSNDKQILIQPTIYVGPENITDPNASPSETAGRITLVR